MSLLFTSAYAAAPAPAATGFFSSQGLMQIAPLALVFIVFYFLLIRPQQMKQKKLKEELGGLRRGDKVVTAGGIVGVVQAGPADSEEIELEIASGVKIKVLRRTIASVVSAKPANDA